MPDILTSLFDYQKDGANFLIQKDRCLLADEMGLGKTIQTIAATFVQDLRPILVICPNSLKWNWAKEFKMWAPSMTTTIVEGDRVTRQQQLSSETDVTIINFEMLRRARRQPRSKDDVENESDTRPTKRPWTDDVIQLSMTKWQIVIVDEAHRVKNRKIATTEGVKLLTKKAPAVYLLTGTPILNRLDELWSLLNIIDPKTYSSFWRFVERYCYVSNNGFGAEIGELRQARLPELRRLLDKICLRRLKHDVLKSLPGKLPIKQVWIHLDPEQRRIYNEMATQMYTQLTSGEVVSATVVIAQITRLKQIAIDYHLMLEERGILEGTKANALLDIVESAEGQKIVIFSQFARVLDRTEQLLQSYHCTTVKITGDVTGRDRDEAVERFQQDSRVQICLCGLKSGGVGITLTSAHLAIFLDKFWSPAMNWQAQERLDRIGQTEPVTIVEILALGTVEEAIEEMLVDKIEQFASIFDITDPGLVTIPTKDKLTLLEILKFGTE